MPTTTPKAAKQHYNKSEPHRPGWPARRKQQECTCCRVAGRVPGGPPTTLARTPGQNDESAYIPPEGASQTKLCREESRIGRKNGYCGVAPRRAPRHPPRAGPRSTALAPELPCDLPVDEGTTNRRAGPGPTRGRDCSTCSRTPTVYRGSRATQRLNQILLISFPRAV